MTGVRVEHPETIATAIRIGNPASWKSAIAARDESGGLIGSVTDDEILEAYRMVAALEGVFTEPACAAPIAGIRKLVNQGYFTQPATITVTLTGHGLKDPDTAISQARSEPVRLPATYDAVLKALAL